jgi:hypothetical protein
MPERTNFKTTDSLWLSTEDLNTVVMEGIPVAKTEHYLDILWPRGTQRYIVI